MLRFFRQALKQSMLLVPVGILAGWLLAGCQCGNSQLPIQWEIERETPVVETGLAKPLTPVAVAGFQPLPDQSLVETDAVGEALLRGTQGSSVCRIYLYNDSALEKKPCPRSSTTGSNSSCLEEGSAMYGNCYRHIIMTGSAQAMVTGSWAAVTYLPQQELTLIVVFEGIARVWPVVDTDNWTLGTSMTLTARQFLYTVPDARLGQIGDLPVPARQPLSLDRLPALTAKLGMGTDVWVRKACNRSDIEQACPGCCAGLAPTRSPTPHEVTKPTSTLVPSRTRTSTPVPSPTFTPTATGSPTPTATRTPTPTPIPVTVQILADRDTFLSSSAPSMTFGSDPYSRQNLDIAFSYPSATTAKLPPYEAVALLHFDVSAIPPGAIVDSAYMELYLYDQSAYRTIDVGVYSLNSDWDENQATYANGPSWSSVGSTWQLDASMRGLYMSFGLMKSFVDSWRNGPNYGLGLRGPSSGQSYWVRFKSKEYVPVNRYDQADPPRLTVTYHVPGP